VAGGRAICTVPLPAASEGRRLTGSLALTTPEAEASRRFSFTVR